MWGVEPRGCPTRFAFDHRPLQPCHSCGLSRCHPRLSPADYPVRLLTIQCSSQGSHVILQSDYLVLCRFDSLISKSRHSRPFFVPLAPVHIGTRCKGSDSFQPNKYYQGLFSTYGQYFIKNTGNSLEWGDNYRRPWTSDRRKQGRFVPCYK